MFQSLPQAFRTHKLQADVRSLLLLQKSFENGLVKTFGDLFVVLKGIIVKKPQDIGPFSKAYYEYFLNIQFKPGETLGSAITRSVAFQEWKENYLESLDDEAETPDLQSLIDRFLDQVHLTSYDIKKIIDGKQILEQDNPDLEDQIDQDANASQGPNRPLDRASDFSDIDINELLDRMRRVADQQKDQHFGGSHWIGQGGISPYGFGGAAKGGIRVGGAGGGKMARKVIGDARYFPVDKDEQINDNNIDASLASLKGVISESAEEELDVQGTIDMGLKRGGLFVPELKDKISREMKVILLIDNGGYSMNPYIHTVTQLFKKMKTRFAHDLKTFYFHNTIYEYVFTDARRSERMNIDRFLKHSPDYNVFIIGDAAMAPYELGRSSIQHWLDIANKFKKAAWLNPDRQEWWEHTFTTKVIQEIFEMYPLTPNGIEKAVLEMNRKGRMG